LHVRPDLGRSTASPRRTAGCAMGTPNGDGRDVHRSSAGLQQKGSPARPGSAPRPPAARSVGGTTGPHIGKSTDARTARPPFSRPGGLGPPHPKPWRRCNGEARAPRLALAPGRAKRRGVFGRAPGSLAYCPGLPPETPQTPQPDTPGRAMHCSLRHKPGTPHEVPRKMRHPWRRHAPGH
jgi:hypothetical protein